MKRPWVGFLTVFTLATCLMPGSAQPKNPAVAAPTPVSALTPVPNSPTPAATPAEHKGDKPIVPGPNTEEPTTRPGESPTPSVTNATSGIWISDTDNARVVHINDMTGANLTQIGIPGHGVGRFLDPSQIWVDSKGRIYVADKGNNRIVRFEDTDGRGWTEMGGFKAPEGVAVRGEQLYVADTGNNRILIYDGMNGNLTRTITDIRAQKPASLWFDADNQLFACCGEDPPGGRLVKLIDVNDTENAKWKTYEGQGLKPTGFAPGAIVTEKGAIWLADTSSNRLVRLESLDGQGAKEFGGYGNNPGRWIRPQGMGLDKAGNVYVADTGNDRIVRFDPATPTKFTVWNGVATAADGINLRAPHSVFVWSPVTPYHPPAVPKKKKKESPFKASSFGPDPGGH